MPEGIGRGVPAQPEATAQATEPTVSSSAGQAPKTAPESAPARKRKTAADKLAEAVAEFGDAMLVVGPDPVDPFPVALELGFDSAPDPKKKAKGMVKPKGWPMPQDAKLLEGRDLDALREGCDGGQEGEGQEPSSDSLSSGQSLQPAPVAAAEVESQLAPIAAGHRWRAGLPRARRIRGYIRWSFGRNVGRGDFRVIRREYEQGYRRAMTLRETFPKRMRSRGIW